MGTQLRAAIVGATGLAGQQFLVSLAHHPYFQITKLAGSARSAGKTYKEAITDDAGAQKWYDLEPLPLQIAEMPVWNAEALSVDDVDVVFSAVETDAAKRLEPQFATKVPVISTASAFRYDEDVPLFLPGVNLKEHLPLLDQQQKQRGWKGFVAPGPNCTVTGLGITLKPLLERFGLTAVVMTSLQSCSGAGRTSGVLGLDIFDNVIPYIPKEEEKVTIETKKILGDLMYNIQGSAIATLPIPVSCTCTRVPVLEGHTEAVFVGTKQPISVETAKQAMEEFGKEFLQLNLPSAPKRMIQVHSDPFRPQPRLDRDQGAGMTTVVGRLREEQVFGGHGIKYVLVSHNTKMGAAKGAILVAEYLVHVGRIG